MGLTTTMTDLLITGWELAHHIAIAAAAFVTGWLMRGSRDGDDPGFLYKSQVCETPGEDPR